MKVTRQPNDLGRSHWRDNITRDFLDDGTSQRRIGELSLTGLTTILPASRIDFRGNRHERTNTCQ